MRVVLKCMGVYDLDVFWKHKIPQICILSGKQGIGKSLLLSRLGRDWFNDSITSFDGKEARENLRGVWIVELGEMTAFSRSESEAAKQFLSQTEDRYRAAYGRRTVQYPRRCVFFGTSNSTDFLRDATGNRRYWPIDCSFERRTKLVHDDLTATQVSDLCDELKDVDGITQVVSLDSITGPGFDTELLPDSVMEILQSGGYKLILANSSYKTGTDAINSQLDEMIGLIKNVDPEGVITGEGAMTKDLIEVADVDFKNVNVWSIMAVLVIIAISFKSISIPVLLVASIEAAIAINMGIPYFTGTQLPFIASIVIGTIQLGATVDYSILMTTRYHEERAFGRTPKEAAQQSLEHCSQSILTSGLTFFAATVGVAAISKMELLRSICLLISRGALISMLVILVVLPAALMLCDWLIRHTTLKWMVPESANAKKSEKE